MEEYMSKAKRILFLCLAIMLIATVAVTACAPAATPTEAPTAAPAKPASTAVPAATAVPPTKAPTVAPTPIPAKCEKMANAPTVKAGEWGSPDKPLVITYVPSGDTGKITKAGTAIADCLSKETGLTIKIEVGTSFGGSIEAMGAQKAQIGFLNTFSVLLAVAKYQVVPAMAVVRKYATPAGFPDPDAALKDTPQDFYKAEFLTKTTSGINTLADLKGKTFCFVEPNSTSGYVVPNIILKSQGIDPTKDFKNVVMAGGHDKVAIAVYKGDCDAGVTFVDTRTDTSYKLYETYKDIGTVLKVFYLSDRLPNDGIQYIKQLDPKVQAALTAGLEAMSADPGGKQILKALYNVDLYKKIEPTYYDAFTAALKAAGVDPVTLVK
jgi:phosphonate transport system substrate-binding protein